MFTLRRPRGDTRLRGLLVILLCFISLEGSADVVDRASVNKSSEFKCLVRSIIAVESGGDPTAVSPKGALGIMQVMQFNLEAAIGMCGLPSRYYDLLVPDDNVMIGTCLLANWLREVDGNIVRALILYNGGYRQLDNFLEKGKMVRETEQYVNKVMDKAVMCLEVNL